MKVTTAERPSREVQLNIEVEPADIEPAMRKAARKLAAELQIPGFRRGKAPYQVVLGFVGRESLVQEALDTAMPDLYAQALKTAGLEPIAPGHLEDLQLEPLVIKMIVPLRPVVEPGPYHELRLPFDEPAATDDLVQEQLERLRREHATIEPAERPAQIGDQVRLAVAVESRESGERLFADDDLDVTLGADMGFPAPGFQQYVVGLSAGEQRTADVDYPEVYQEEELAGAQANLRVTVHEVKQVTLPALDDEFAKTVGDYDSLLALRVATREALQDGLHREAENNYAQEAIDALAEHASVEYPPTLLDEEIDDLMRELEERLKRELHLSLDDYLKMAGKTREALREEFRPRADQRLRRGLVLAEIAQREGLAVTDADVEAEIEALSASFGEASETARKVFGDERNRETIFTTLMNRKTISRLVEIARGTYRPPEPAEAAAAPAAPAVEASAAPEAPAGDAAS